MSTSDAWDKWATEMVKKFPLKRLCKRLPKTNWLQKFAEIEEKQLERSGVIQLEEEKPSGEVAAEAWKYAVNRGENHIVRGGDRVVPTRVDVNRLIRDEFVLLTDQQVERLEMDRELTDYLEPERTSDEEAREFLKRIGSVRS
jgi:hypothetical protein